VPLQEKYWIKTVLDKIDATTIVETIIVGSLVKANGIYLYLSVALPNKLLMVSMLSHYHLNLP
jgi:hypothetical protein